MRVIQFRAENFMGLKAVEITPDEHLVTISGRNGQGKSSILNALWAAIAGGGASRQVPAPVRRGTSTAEVTVDLGDLRVTRTWKEGGSTAGALKVVAADGVRLSSPQAVLDKLMGALTFEPLAFTRLSEREQVAALLAVVVLPFDPAELAATRQGLYDRRRDVNREVSRLRGELDNKPPVPAGTPTEKVSISTLAGQHATATRAHAEHRSLIRDAEDAARRVQALDQHAAQVEAEIARLQGELTRTQDDAARSRVQVEEAQAAVHVSAGRLPDVEAIAGALAQAEQVNDLVQVAIERATLTELADEQQRIADGLTRAIDALDARRERALAVADMPVPGLSFTDEGVTLAGVPLKACSGAEQLRTSVAIAMAANPTLRVVRVTDGSLLDPDGMRLLADMAKERDMQVWCEVVDASGEVGIVIEDGEVYAVNEAEPVGAGR